MSEKLLGSEFEIEYMAEAIAQLCIKTVADNWGDALIVSDEQSRC